MNARTVGSQRIISDDDNALILDLEDEGGVFHATCSKGSVTLGQEEFGQTLAAHAALPTDQRPLLVYEVGETLRQFIPDLTIEEAVELSAFLFVNTPMLLAGDSEAPEELNNRLGIGKKRRRWRRSV